MRIKLALLPRTKEELIPINYQYPLSSAIYKILAAASAENARFLHTSGYVSSRGRALKLFTFSKLFSPGIKRFRSSLILNQSSPCTLYISSPMLNDFVQNIVIGLFEKEMLEIGGPHSVGHFTISHVETIDAPDFCEEMKFTCLSPIVSSTAHEHQGKLSQYYFRPGDRELSSVLVSNLQQKYELIHGESAADLKIEFTPDMDYVQRRQKDGKRVTKKITIKEGDDVNSTDVIAFELPFMLSGDPELISVAYEAGIGEKNSMGFGMIDLAVGSENQALPKS